MSVDDAERPQAGDHEEGSLDRRRTGQVRHPAARHEQGDDRHQDAGTERQATWSVGPEREHQGGRQSGGSAHAGIDDAQRRPSLGSRVRDGDRPDGERQHETGRRPAHHPADHESSARGPQEREARGTDETGEPEPQDPTAPGQVTHHAAHDEAGALEDDAQREQALEVGRRAQRGTHGRHARIEHVRIEPRGTDGEAGRDERPERRPVPAQIR